MQNICTILKRVPGQLGQRVEKNWLYSIKIQIRKVLLLFFCKAHCCMQVKNITVNNTQNFFGLCERSVFYIH